MCLASNTPNSSKARIFLIVGLLCLVVSLGSQSMSLTFGLPAVPLHFLRGFLLGFAIVMLFSSAWRTGRRRPSSSPPPAI